MNSCISWKQNRTKRKKKKKIYERTLIIWIVDNEIQWMKIWNAIETSNFVKSMEILFLFFFFLKWTWTNWPKSDIIPELLSGFMSDFHNSMQLFWFKRKKIAKKSEAFRLKYAWEVQISRIFVQFQPYEMVSFTIFVIVSQTVIYSILNIWQRLEWPFSLDLDFIVFLSFCRFSQLAESFSLSLFYFAINFCIVQ